MVEALARLLVKRPVAWAVVVLTVVVAAASGALSLQLEQDDDLLAFLPESNPDIATFHRINEAFGSTDVALVGLPVEDPFDPVFLRALRDLSDDLRAVPGLDTALTLTNVSDFAADPETGGIITSELVDQIPETEADKAALRAKVMSREQIVGTLISPDADAVLVYAFATTGTPPRDFAASVREVVLRHFSDRDVQWGGAPFISSFIFDTTQADMRRLTPFAVLAILGIMFVAFRGVVGTTLGLLATCGGILVSRAAMVVFDVPFNILLSSMPVILFAVGSAYAIHILSHYDRHARDVGATPEAIVRTLVGTGPTVVTAGLTTVAGLLSFVMMDMEPMQVFGAFTALGLFVALVLSLTFVPAVISLFPRKVQPDKPRMGDVMSWMVSRIRARRPLVGVCVGLIVAAGVGFVGAVESRMDLAAFFHQGSAPDRAQTFLEDHFGGSQFLQLHIEGPLDDPAVLREVERLSDQIRPLPHVSNVQGIDDVLALVTEAMTGARRIPDTKGQAGAIFAFAQSDPNVKRLISSAHDQAVLQIKLDTDESDALDASLEALAALVEDEAISRGTVITRDDDSAQMDAVLAEGLTVFLAREAHQLGEPVPDDLSARVATWLAQPAPAAAPGPLADDVRAFLQSEECFVPLTPEQADAVATAAVSLGPDPGWLELEEAVATALALEPADTTVQDLLVALDAPLGDLRRAGRGVAGASPLLDASGVRWPAEAREAVAQRLAWRLQDREAPTAFVPDPHGDVTLSWTVSGMPVLYRGMAKSVTANQFKSLGFALVLVFVLMTLYYRSLFIGLLATAPTVVTLIICYGVMGAAGMQLDVGTSMLASIIIGAGVDYAVHLLAAWQTGPGGTPDDAARNAADETSHAIWTNAAMVAAGFFVLTLGDSKPLQNVGLLTAGALITAALATFVVIPLLAQRRQYREPAVFDSPST